MKDENCFHMETIFEDLLLFTLYQANKLLTNGLDFLKGESIEHSLNLDKKEMDALLLNEEYMKKIDKYQCDKH